MADTLVFIPAWNEEASLPAVLADARAELPDVDLLVIDDGSTDGTAAVDGGSCPHPARTDSAQGKRAVELVVTIGLTLFAARLLRQRHQHPQRREFARVLRPTRSRLTPW